MKNFIAVLTAILTVFVSVLCCNAQSNGKIGDVNQDGIVDVADATQLQLYLAEICDINSDVLQLCDTNADGDVNVMDVTYIQLYLARIIEEFPTTIPAPTPTPPSYDDDGYNNQIVKP